VAADSLLDIHVLLALGMPQLLRVGAGVGQGAARAEPYPAPRPQRQL
jgi:hypothetical protein